MKNRTFVALFLTASMVFASLAPATTSMAQTNEDYSDAVEVNLSKNTPSLSAYLSNSKDKLSKDREVSIIVEVKEDSLVDEFLDTKEDDLEGYLSSKDACSTQKDISSTVQKVSAKVLREVKDTTLQFEYDTVFTGFAVKTTAGSLEDIKSIKGVKDAYIAEEYATPSGKPIKPNMLSSADMIFAKEASNDFKVAGDGMVIGVLDTGIDYGHEAFAEDKLNGIPVAITKSSITNKVNNLELDSEKIFKSIYSTSYNVTDVYQNLKVPYAYDYADNDLSPVPPKTEDHGTHVAGTIAGNCKEFKGIAYNAQLMIFKVFSDNGGGCTDASLIAALDDAVKLGVDVINMSLGSTSGFVKDENEALQQAYDLVKAAGINLEVAAGNEAGSSTGSNYGDYNLTENPDESTVGNPSTLSAALSVAAMENTKLNYQNVLTIDEKEIVYTDSSQESSNPWKSVEAGDYKYVSCGIGTPAEIKKIKSKLKGNIALISRGEITFEEKIQNAANAGAIAALIYNNEPGSISMAVDNYYVPAVSLLMDDGKTLLDAIDKKTGYGILTIDPTKKANVANPMAGTMCSFTSIGPTPSLTLKPEITAPGGNIYSAYYVDDDGSSVSGLMSGTSMATPHMAGATAIIRQYYKHKYPSMGSLELANLIHSVEMSTATPIVQTPASTNGTDQVLPIYYSPRTQGSGLVNIKAALSTNAYLLVSGQERPKAELGYNETGSYSFETSIINKGSSSKTFQLNGNVQAEDYFTDSYHDSYAAQQDLDLTNNGATITFKGTSLSEDNTITVPANGKATITVEIQLDKNHSTIKELSKVYKNGFYVEGFVFATPADENGITLSLPYLGFYGDYANLPIFDEMIGDYYSGKNLPVWSQGCCLTGFDSELTLGTDIVKLLLTGEPNYSSSKVYTSVFSENGATAKVLPNTFAKTNVSKATYTYKNSKGKVIKTYTYNNLRKTVYDTESALPMEAYIPAETPEEYPIFTGYDENGKILPNGKYTVEIKATSTLGGKEQKISSSFKVDNTAPTLSSYAIESKNNVYVYVKAKDNETLEGFSLYYGELASNSATLLWKPTKNGTMILKIKKNQLPANYDVSKLLVSIYDGAYNRTTVNVEDKIKLTAPTIKKASISGSGIKLNLKKVKDATGYKIYRSTSKKGSFKYIGTTKKLSYTDSKSLKSGKTYYYKVAAYKKYNGITETGSYSAIKKVRFH